MLQLAAAIWIKYSCSCPSSQESKIKEIALIRPDAIGDFFIFIQYARSLREAYPKDKFRITLFSHPLHQSLSDEFLDIDHFIPMNSERLRNHKLEFFQFMQQSHQQKYWQVIMCPYSRDWMNDCFILSLNSRRKIGWDGDCANINPYLKKISSLFYDELRNYPPMEQRVNEYEVNQKMLQTGPQQIEFPKNNTIACFIGSSWPGRSWSAEKFAELINKISTLDFKIQLLGGPTDIEKANKVASLLPNHLNFKNLVGKTTLLELVKVIGQASLLVSTESSAMHAASLTGTESIIIMGGGHFGRFTPNTGKCHIINYLMDCYYCNWNCPYYIKGQAVPCIDKIETENIIREVVKYVSI